VAVVLDLIRNWLFLSLIKGRRAGPQAQNGWTQSFEKLQVILPMLCSWLPPPALIATQPDK
jgi:hypothetical protein